jgi:hypothetical protein
VREEIGSEAAPTVSAVAVVEPDAPADGPAIELSLDAFVDVWPAIVSSLQGEYPMLAALLEGARPSALSGDDLTLAWPHSSAFMKRSAEDPAKRELIARAIRSVTGASLRLAYDLSDDAPAAAPRLTEEELVERFQKEFDAEVVPPEEDA